MLMVVRESKKVRIHPCGYTGRGYRMVHSRLLNSSKGRVALSLVHYDRRLNFSCSPAYDAPKVTPRAQHFIY